jgi:glycosyltransferase involved in cell wall biosynthesis
MMTKTDISIVLCTYNRASRLAVVLESLAGLKTVNELSHEILVVDNNSSDNTRDVIESVRAVYPGLIRHVFESRQGLSWARNRGIEDAMGGLIAFTDDDIIVDQNWLRALTLASVTYTHVGFGGRILPKWDFTPPSWFIGSGPFNMLKGGVVVGHDLGDKPLEYRMGMQTPVGANMVFRREVFERHGLFRIDLGKTGKRVFFGEDAEFCGRLLRAGEKLLYLPQAIIYHPVDSVKMTKSHFKISYFNIGRSIGRRWNYPKDAVCCFGVPRHLIRKFLVQVIKGVVTLGCGQHRKAFFHKLESYRLLGQIVETFRFPFFQRGAGNR